MGDLAKAVTLRALAAVAELVDAPGLGPGAARREGSSPFGRTSFGSTPEPAGDFSRTLMS